MTIGEICNKYNIGYSSLSKYLKDYLHIKIEKRIKVKFNEHIFDSIDTEEKAYLLGFIFADGTISSYPLEEGKKNIYTFELSLKADDYSHLEKLKYLLNTDRPILVSENRCRLLVNSKHFWKTLNSYGCTPRKSLTLKFPSKSIFKDRSLIRYFIRGYFDGDGCISYSNKGHTSINMQLLGTKEFLDVLLTYLPKEFQDLTIRHNHNNVEEKTYFINTSKNKAYRFFKFLYLDSTIYLNRKYLRFARYHSNMIIEKDKFGEDCDVNTELTNSISQGELVV